MSLKVAIAEVSAIDAFNLLGGVNQGYGLLLARGLEKRQPVALVNTPEKIECSLIRVEAI